MGKHLAYLGLIHDLQDKQNLMISLFLSPVLIFAYLLTMQLIFCLSLLILLHCSLSSSASCFIFLYFQRKLINLTQLY
jgi:hypothetical protein